MLVLITPRQDHHIMPVPYCSVQFITNYQYKRQAYMYVATIVLPVTGYMDKLYPNIDVTATSCAISKGFLSSLRV